MNPSPSSTPPDQDVLTLSPDPNLARDPGHEPTHPDDQHVLHNSSWVLSNPIVWNFGLLALTFPFWPVYFRSVGLTESQIALLLGIPPVAALIAQQGWGYLADTRLNIRFTVMIMSVLSAAAAALIPLFNSFWALLGVLSLFQAVSAARLPMMSAMILDNKDGEARYGGLRTLGSISFIGVLLLAGPMTDSVRFGGIKLIFPALILFNLMCVLAHLPVKDFPPGKRPTGTPRGTPRPGFVAVQRTMLSNPVILAFIPFLLISQLPHVISHSMLSLLVIDYGIGSTYQQATAPVMIGAIAEIAIFLGFTRLASRVRLMPLILITTLAQVVRWGGIYLVPTLGMVYLTSVLHALTYGLMHMCAVLLFNRELPPSLRSSGQGMLAILFLLFGVIFGHLLNSFFLAYVGNLLLWYGFAAVLSALSIPFWMILKRRYEQRHNVSGFWVTVPVPEATEESAAAIAARHDKADS